MINGNTYQGEEGVMANVVKKHGISFELASISTGNILITPVAIGNPPGLSPVGSSHCGSLADPVLKELSDAAPARKGYRQILKHFTIEML